MDGFQRRTEQKKDDILRAAKALFKTYGFSKVSVADIAREAHVSHVTIYNYFGNKDSLVRDIIKTIMTDIVTQSNELVKSDIPFLEKLDGIISGKVQTAGYYQGELALMVRGNPELRSYLDDLWEHEVNTILQRLLEEGQAGGYISRDISLESVLLFNRIIRAWVYALDADLRKLKGDLNLVRGLNHLFIFGLVDKIPSPD